MSILILQGPNKSNRSAVASYFQAGESTARVPVEVLTCPDVSGVVRALTAGREHGVEVVILELGNLSAEFALSAPQALVQALHEVGVPFIEVAGDDGPDLEVLSDHQIAPLASVLWIGERSGGLRMGLAIARNYLKGRGRLRLGGAGAANDPEGGQHIRVETDRRGPLANQSWLDEYELGGYAGI
ncbi:hypothetical protein [Pinirhizobacter sp.]|jgi:hypothetical protein|uniref:hypothetical protein n=1 Tax=Pinirhizobacter sp. TaxID=2950432 RepID=UPI002F413F72